MNELLIIASAASALLCTILLAVYIARLISAYHSKTLLLNRQSAMKTVFVDLDDIIRTSVATANQSASNNRSQERSIIETDNKEIIEQYRSRVYTVVRPNQLRMLQPYMENIDEWVNDRIEYYARMNK